MSANAKTVYVIPKDGATGDTEEAWASPVPVDAAIAEAVVEATDLSADDVDDIDAYVDAERLVTLFSADSSDETLTFDVEGHAVTVHATGDIDVEA